MKLYTKTICPKCLWVKSELQQAGLSADWINIDHDTAAMEKIQQAGFSSVPILEVNGELIGDIPNILSKIEAMQA
ncbi:glutaredoxin [Lysinibacillus sp. KU-BSD001]|uniref:glutaredoxin family protein n=1 Tax=Lysinibacillus sp. KU-BSD001 TaxID=3141328 RepID=UPI0036EFCEC5